MAGYGIGGLVCEIVRDGVSHTGEHSSEIQLPRELVDWVILNTSLKELKEMASVWDPFRVGYTRPSNVRHSALDFGININPVIL